MRLIDADKFEVYTATLEGTGYEGDAAIAYMNGMTSVLEKINDAETIHIEALPLVISLRQKIKTLEKKKSKEEKRLSEENTIGGRIRKLRTEKCLTQGELGKIIGVKRETINQWESNSRDLKTQRIIDLAKFFGVTADYLLGLEPEEKKEMEEDTNA